MNVTQTATTIDTSAPAAFTCADCPFARHIDGNRYCCQVSQTSSDVKRGHWEATISCYEALAAAEAEKEATLVATTTEVEAPIAQTDTTDQTPIAPATHSTLVPATLSAKKTAPVTTTTATGTNGDEPPNRGDNGRGRVQPTAAPKKLMLSLVSVKRITSDVPASNFDSFDLEVAGELSLTIGGFVIPPVLVRDSRGYKVISGHFQYHAAVMARRLNPRAGETIPAIVLEAENQSAVLAQLEMLKLRAVLGF
jgi:hypothetical protein